MDWRMITNERERYAAYLCSREWSEKREAVRKRCGGRCERCECYPMDACHHLTYARKYNESLTDLQGICNHCHGFTHGKSHFDPAVAVEINKLLVRHRLSVSQLKEVWDIMHTNIDGILS